MLNIKDTEDKKIYISSDFHLGHRQPFIWQTRGYTSVEDHDKFIINTVNQTVKYDDILFFLGDFCLNTSLPQFEEYLSRIQCNNIYMLLGNHNSPHYKDRYIPCIKTYLGALYEEGMELFPIRYRNIVYIGNQVRVILNGQFIVLSHYPLYSWDEMKRGSWMLHGHEHSAVKDHLPEGNAGKILDVSWDYFKKPLSLPEIKVIMDKKEIVSIGHH